MSPDTPEACTPFARGYNPADSMGVGGILGRKVGMTQMFTDEGTCLGVTAIEVGPCVVLQVKTPETDGYFAAQLGFDDVKEKRAAKPAVGHARKAGTPPKRFIREVPWDGQGGLKPGDRITLDVLEGAKAVDVIGRTKGRGFAGVVKRWHFRGGPATHGQSDRERAPGALGRQGSNPGDVIKNKKMAGRYGNERVTALNLRLVRMLKDQNVILVHGAVPGPNGGYVIVRPSNRS